MPTIDGDAHVMEGPQTWEYCDPSERKFMPVLLNPGPEADRQFWLVDGKIRGHVRHVIKPKDFHALAQASGRDMVVPPEAQHLEDVPARIRHKDEMGIDIQVMYPTIFIQQVTDKPEFEVPICKAYNRWMADVWKQGNGRLRWVCVLPLLSLRDSIDILPASCLKYSPGCASASSKRRLSGFPGSSKTSSDVPKDASCRTIFSRPTVFMFPATAAPTISNTSPSIPPRMCL